MREPRATTEMTTPTQRIEAFSDGVFAIAITLLILEIQVPQLQDAEGSGNVLSLTRPYSVCGRPISALQLDIGSGLICLSLNR